MSNGAGPRGFMDDKNADQGDSEAMMRWTRGFRRQCCRPGGTGPRKQGPDGKSARKCGP